MFTAIWMLLIMPKSIAEEQGEKKYGNRWKGRAEQVEDSFSFCVPAQFSTNNNYDTGSLGRYSR